MTSSSIRVRRTGTRRVTMLNVNHPDPLDMSGRTISGTGGKSIVAVGIFLAGAAMTLAPLTAAATSTGEAETMLSTDTDDGETDLPAGSNDG